MDRSVLLVFGALVLVGFTLVNAAGSQGWNRNSMEGRTGAMMDAMQANGISHEEMHKAMHANSGELPRAESSAHGQMHAKMHNGVSGEARGEMHAAMHGNADAGVSHAELHERMHGEKLSEEELEEHCGGMEK